MTEQVTVSREMLQLLLKQLEESPVEEGPIECWVEERLRASLKYLIEHECEIFSEEGLQRALSEMSSDPKYTAPQPVQEKRND